MKKKDKVREVISSGLAVCFYILFILFAWYVAYQMSLEFYTGENVAMPDNPKMIPDEVLEPTMHFVVQRILLITGYAFVFGNWTNLWRKRKDASDPSKKTAPHGALSARAKAVFWPKRSCLWTIPWWAQVVILAVFSWTIRMDVIELIGQDTVQIVDFDRVFRMSLREGSIVAEVQGINFYRAFPNWALYVKLIHCLNVHFGAVPLTGIMWNAIASTASVVLVYLIVYLASGKDVLAILSALLFSINPFYLYYEILLSPDFTFIFLCLGALLVFVSAWRFTKSIWIRLPAALVFGVTLALSSFFKSVDKVLIIALMIVLILQWIARGRFTKERAMKWAAIAAVFIVGYSATMSYSYNYIDNYVSGNSNRDVSPYFLNVGLNAEHGGQWSQEVLDVYLGLIREYDYDFDIINEKMKDHLDEVIEAQKLQVASGENPDLWTDFMEYKLRKAWGNNEGLRFVMNTINKENPLAGMAFYEEYLPVVQAFTVATGFLMFLGGIGGLLTRERKTVMVSALMVFGFALLLLLSEVQPRYKTVVYPFMAVVSAYGIYCIIQPIWLLIKRFYREKSI